MSSLGLIVTLASDILVLGAAFSFVAVVFKYLWSQYRNYIPTTINTTIDGIRSNTGKDDDPV